MKIVVETPQRDYVVEMKPTAKKKVGGGYIPSDKPAAEGEEFVKGFNKAETVRFYERTTSEEAMEHLYTPVQINIAALRKILASIDEIEAVEIDVNIAD